MPVPAGARRAEEAGEAVVDHAEAGRGRQAADQAEPEEPGRKDVALQDFHLLRPTLICV